MLSNSVVCGTAGNLVFIKSPLEIPKLAYRKVTNSKLKEIKQMFLKTDSGGKKGPLED